MKAIIKIEYKNYRLKCVARPDGLYDMAIRKLESGLVTAGVIVDMPEEDIRKWFEEWVDGKENESNTDN